MIAKGASLVVYFDSFLTTGGDNTSTTPATEVSKDGGSAAGTTNTPTHVNGPQWVVTLTATEMNADVVGFSHTATSCESDGFAIYTESVWTSTKAGYLTGDAYIRLGAPAGASVSADVAAVLTSVGLRLLTSAYTAPDNTDITTILSDAAALVTSIGSGLHTDLTAVKTVTDKLGMTIDSTGRVTLSPTALAGLVVETGIDPLQAIRLILAAVAGVLSGAGTSTITFEGGGVSTVRITGTVDGAGNRTAVTLSP